MFRSPEGFGNHGENPIPYIESPKFKQALQKLESVAGIGPQHRVIILATALDLKPAGEIDFRGTPEDKNEFTQVLSELGLFFCEDSERYESYKEYAEKGFSHYVIGNTPENIGEALQASAANDHHFGTAMGFPETAVHAYSRTWEESRDDLLIPINEYGGILTKEEKAFTFFRLSKESYAKEIEWVEQLIAAVKKHSPELYRQVMASAAWW